MYKLAVEHVMEKEAMRDIYCSTLIDVAEKNQKLITVEVDVMHSMGTIPFMNRFHDRVISCGIQEANAVGLCAGLSVTGFIPFFHAFGTFATRRAYDQIFLSCAYSNANVKIIGGDPGVTAAMNGGTHMPFEDIGIMRNIPNMTIIEPADTTVLRSVVPIIAETYGNFYMRLARKNVIKIYDDECKFEIGKGVILREGDDVTIIACGIMVNEALNAHKMLKERNISARVVDMFTIKPIDTECIIESSKKTGAIVTAENHSIINGLGSAVSEVVVRNFPVPVESVGINDEFGEVGDQQYLMKRFGITANDIFDKVIKVINRKE